MKDNPVGFLCEIVTRIPVGILHRVLQESFIGSYRNPSQGPTGILHRVLLESFTGSHRNPSQSPTGILETKIKQPTCFGNVYYLPNVQHLECTLLHLRVAVDLRLIV